MVDRILPRAEAGKPRVHAAACQRTVVGREAQAAVLMEERRTVNLNQPLNSSGGSQAYPREPTRKPYEKENI